MANTLIMMRMKHTARNELKDITPAFFEKYKDYLLGDYVYGLRASDDYGGMIPPWTLVLSYEHAIRKHCYKTMAQQGLPFKLALEKSWKDATVKERHFTTPLALYAKRDTRLHPRLQLPRKLPPAKAIRARARASSRARRAMLGPQPTSRYASATTPREAARRRVNAISSTYARYALAITLLPSARREIPGTLRARLTDTYRQLLRYQNNLLL